MAWSAIEQPSIGRRLVIAAILGSQQSLAVADALTGELGRPNTIACITSTRCPLPSTETGT
jgi:hypothetical protein